MIYTLTHNKSKKEGEQLLPKNNIFTVDVPQTPKGKYVKLADDSTLRSWETSLGLEKKALDPDNVNNKLADIRCELYGAAPVLDTETVQDAINLAILRASGKARLATEDPEGRAIFSIDQQGGSHALVGGSTLLQNYNMLSDMLRKITNRGLKAGLIIAATSIKPEELKENATSEELESVFNNYVYSGRSGFNSQRVNRAYAKLVNSSREDAWAEGLLWGGIYKELIEDKGQSYSKRYVFEGRQFNYTDMVAFFKKGIVEDLESTQRLLSELSK